MAALPTGQHTAFVLHVLDERSIKSVANVLGTTVSAIKTRLFKARQALSRRARRDTWFAQRTPVRK